MSQQSDQKENVITQEVVKPSDQDVVVSDAPAEAPEPRESATERKPSAAASPDDKGKSPNDQESATGDDKQTQNRQKGVEKRIKRLTRKLAESEEARQATESQLEAMRQELDELKAQRKKPEKPKLEDFKDPEEYAEAYQAWKAETKESKSERKPPAKPQKQPTPAELPPEIKAFHEKGFEKFGDDFKEALEERFPVNQLMGEYMIDHELGTDLFLYLANNPEEAFKINDSSPYRATKLLNDLAAKAEKGELEDVPDGQLQFEEEDKGKKDEKQEKPQKKRGGAASRAPEPANHKPEGEHDGKQDLEKMDMDDYAAMRQKQELAKMGYVPGK